jgi:colanic acid biosynthesis glycosyl transferase WcaI
MRILIFGINYTPELTGIGKYTGEMAGWLAAQSHEVEVITAPPYYPEWHIRDAYQGRGWVKELLDGVTVYRCPLYVPAKVTSAKRIIHEFSFLAATLPIWMMKLFQKKFDIVISINPPFHLGILPLLYSKLKGVKYISHIQDLQVDAAKELGMIRNKKLLDVMFSMEKFILRQGAAVSTISPGMQKKIEAKGIGVEKLFQFPNWVDEDIIFPLSKEQSLRQEFGYKASDRIVLYSGNLGEKQGLEIIIEVAAFFQHREDIYFVISGTGGAKPKLIQLTQESGLKNVQFHPLQPYEKLSALLAMADVHLVLQKKSASDLVMPSKLTGILAAGGLALVTCLPGTTLYDLITTAEMGIVVEPESVSALRDGIENALAMDTERLRYHARKYAEENLSKTTLLRNLESKLLDLAPNFG